MRNLRAVSPDTSLTSYRNTRWLFYFNQMKTTEVVFKRNYAISPLTMEHMHLQVTVSIEDGESTADALKYAQKQVEDFYADACKQSNPSEYGNYMPADSVKIQTWSFENPPTVSLMEELAAVDNLEVLKSYRYTVKNTEEQSYYELRMRQLSK